VLFKYYENVNSKITHEKCISEQCSLDIEVTHKDARVLRRPRKNGIKGVVVILSGQRQQNHQEWFDGVMSYRSLLLHKQHIYQNNYCYVEGKSNAVMQSVHDMK